MRETKYPVDKFQEISTPFYYYDLTLLRKTLATIADLKLPDNYMIHYALKANANPALLALIRDVGMGADCVSGGEVQAAFDAGFSPSKIVFAGVGKADWEINLALDKDIYCFNVESAAELEVINELAVAKNKMARIALRINPDVEAHTHKYIATGSEGDKFGIGLGELNEAIEIIPQLKNLQFIGMHLHIGSQLMDMNDFVKLSERVGELHQIFDEKGLNIEYINVGGGLGVNYEEPDRYPVPDFEAYFNVFRENLQLREGQILHFELGRSIVAQCGTLISRVLYVKKSGTYQFAVLDAGMTELMRPALYQAYHKIENLTSDEPAECYKVVGPICESSDVFADKAELNHSKRGDIIAIRSAGAYGETMASTYNLRTLPKSYTSDNFDE